MKYLRLYQKMKGIKMEIKEKKIYHKISPDDYEKFRHICKIKGLKMGYILNKFVKEFIKENAELLEKKL